MGCMHVLRFDGAPIYTHRAKNVNVKFDKFHIICTMK